MTNPILTLAAANPVDHVTDKPILEADWGLGYGWVISNVTVMLVLGGIITALIVIPAARRIATTESKPGGRTLDDYRSQGLWANLVETICLYLRDQVFRPVLHDQTDRFVPVLWTFFWFILVCNLLGLIPLLDASAGLGKLIGIDIGYHGHGVGGTATQSIWVTGALAVSAFFFYNLAGLIKDPIGYLKHLTAGAPIYMWPIMIPVEIMGMFVKPLALSLRLFANMTGGHIILAVLLSFVVALATDLGGVAGHGLAIVPLLGATAINLLEILVAFIQAYIFTFLTCLFLGQLVVHHHEHDEHHGHGDGLPHTDHDETVSPRHVEPAPHGAPHH